jgi:hypothetical protein
MPPRQSVRPAGLFSLAACAAVWTAVILVYELDARSFQRAPNG